MDRWLKTIGDKVDKYEMPEPDGLWNAIEDRIESAKPARRSLLLPWMIRFAAVAACVAVAVIFMWMFVDSDLSLEPAVADNGSDNNVIENPAVTFVQDSVQPPVVVAQPITLAQHYKTEGETEPVDPVVSMEEVPDCTSDDIVYENNVRDNNEPTVREVVDRSEGMPYSIVTKRSDSRLALGVFTSGALTASSVNSGRVGSYASLRNMMMDDYAGNETLVRSRSVNSFDSHRFDMRHHLPIRVGVSALYYLSRYVAVEAGVMYSHHRSDLSYSDDIMSVNGEQKLNYIGVPINVQLRIAQWNRLRLYASGGVLCEKLVTGSLSGNVANAKGGVTSKHESLSEKPLQWSVNASAGAQYDLTDIVGIYVEPGVGYHFDNGSPIRNIYKDRDVDFNLNVGLRFNINRR